MIKYTKSASKRIVLTIIVILLVVGVMVMRKNVLFDVRHYVENFEVAHVESYVQSVKDSIVRGFSSEGNNSQAQVIVRIGVMSDSHGFNNNVKKAIAEMKGNDVEMVVHLGDFTAGGEEDSFAKAYEYLESSGLPYIVLPGDHDFNWVPEHSRSNYEKYFGMSYSQIVNLKTVTLLMFDNSVNESSAVTVEWLKKTLDAKVVGNVTILLSAKPLYNPYFTSKNDPLGTEVIDLLARYGITYAVAGDTHVFAEYEDLTHSIDMVTIGAVGEYKAPLPQWVLMEIYDDDTVTFTPHPIIDF